MLRLRWLVPLFLAASVLPAAPGADAAVKHRIGVREGSGGRQELFDRTTGKRFVPRGANLLVKGLEDGVIVDTLFGTQTYAPAFAEQTLTDLEDLGYNTLRVFLDLCIQDCIAEPAGGLRGEYLDNVADLIRRAKEHGIVVLLASADLPDSGGYGETLPCCDPFGGYRNSAYLSKKGVSTLERYWVDVVTGLADADAPLSNILAYELVQEWFVLNDAPPLSLASGLVQTADGHTYDMASDADKRRMVERNLLFLAREVRSAVVEVDPTALVTIGFFPPPGAGALAAGENRILYTDKIVRRSALDLVDLHAYPGVGLDLATQADRWGIDEGTVKPVVMGEFGAFGFAYPSPLSGAEALVAWQAESCGLGFDGWILWLWAEIDDEVWGGTQGAGEVGDLLSPATRPKPCSTGGLPENLALEGTATASAHLPGEEPGLAIDGLALSQWGAGDFAPQSLEIDLGTLAEVERVELAVAQFPEGATVHRIFGRSDPADPWVLLREFSGTTTQGDWLVHAPASAFAVRYLRVETTVSPSWISWIEVRVVGRGI